MWLEEMVLDLMLAKQEKGMEEVAVGTN